jgi:putative inorganic carbon (HCO3(-)) transporter
MIARRALPLAAVLAVGLGSCLAVAIAVAAQSDQAEGFKLAAGVVAGTALVFVALAARPAWTLSIGLALSVFNTHWGNMGIPFSIDRVFLVAGILSVLARQIHAGGWRRLRTEPIHWLLAATALYAVVSTVLAGTLDDPTAQSGLLGRLGLIPFALFFAAPFAFREERDRRVLLGTLVALGAYLGITALLETTGPSWLIVPQYITDPNVGIHFDRARGPLVEASGDGLVMFACLIACVMALGIWRSRRWRQVAIAVAALCALGILFTVTRSVWLGAGIGALAAMLATPRTRRLLVPTAAIAALLVVGAFATIPGLSGKADSRANSQSPLWDRKNSDAAAGRMIDARPLFGFGWGRFGQDSANYYVQNPNYPLSGVADVHNVFLSNAVELGLLGGLLWLVALLAGVGGSILKRGPPELRPWKIGLLALFASWLVIANTTPMSLALPSLLLWAWAGIARGRPEPAPARTTQSLAVGTPAPRVGEAPALVAR